MNAIDILSKYWGYSTFRSKQEEVIQNILVNKDVLAIFPVGEGKSLCYQIPALMKNGVCLVISPLISLITDQLRFLSSKGIKSIAINKNINLNEVDDIFNKCKFGGIKFLFLSPERLQSSKIKRKLNDININLIAVDEAHCISEWGHQFRPSFRKISDLRSILPQTPILALTATANKYVIDDITTNLHFKKNHEIVKTSLKKNNISYLVLENIDKRKKLIELVEKIKSSIIIYANSRKNVENISKYLNYNKYNSCFYHAGLSYENRKNVQEKWIKNQIRIIVATSSFGMGINKRDVRLVINFSLPPNIETYYQQSGRAGRDNKKAYSILLFDENDIKYQQTLLKQRYPKCYEIIDFYNNLSNYLQIPIGSVPDDNKSINIKNFKERYKISSIELYNFLNILQNEGYIIFKGFVKPHSKLKIILDTNNLYKFQIENRLYDQFIRLLLRTYPKLFNEYVSINEDIIAKKINRDINFVKKIFNKLEKLEVVKYQFNDENTINIKYLISRVDSQYLSFNDAEIEKRKKSDLYRLDKMISFCKNQNQCRRNLILKYFDEVESNDCENCSNCLKHDI